MKLSEIKTLLQRIQTILQSLHPKDQKSYQYENYDDGFTVTWRFANVTSPQQIRSDVETAAVWLWSFKDYLKERLAAGKKNPADVEAYVSGCRSLPVLSDIANGAKHGKLKTSRSGRFAKLGECTMSIQSGLRLEEVMDGDADVELTVNDPAAVSYKVNIRDQHNRYMGDAIVLLRNSLTEWKRFIRSQPDIKAVL